MTTKSDALFIGVAETKEELNDAAYWLMKDHVFDSFGMMFDEYLKIIKDRRRDRAVIYYASSEHKVNGRFVFYAALIYHPLINLIHVYVRPDHQGLGIAQILLNALRRNKGIANKILCSWGTNYEGGQEFFKKNFIHTYRTDFTQDEIEAAGGESRVFGYVNRKLKAELKKAMLAHVRERQSQ